MTDHHRSQDLLSKDQLDEEMENQHDDECYEGSDIDENDNLHDDGDSEEEREK